MGRWKVGAQNTAVGKKYRCSLKQSTNQCATFQRHISSIIYTLYPLLQMHSQSPTHKADNLFGRDQCREVVPPSASSGCAKVSIIADSVIVLHYLSYEDMENLDQNQKQMINSIPLFVIPRWFITPPNIRILSPRTHWRFLCSLHWYKGLLRWNTEYRSNRYLCVIELKGTYSDVLQNIQLFLQG